MRFFNPVKFVEKMISYDKALHFIVGNVTFIPIIFVMRILQMKPFYITVYGLLVVVALAIAKEVYDRGSRRGTADANDVVCTLLGAISALVAYLMGVAM